MEKLWSTLQEMGLSIDSCRLTGVMAMAYSGKVPSHDDRILDEYKPIIASLAITGEDSTSLVVEPDSELFQQVSDRLPDIINLPLYSMRVAQGGAAPRDKAEFSYPVQDIKALDVANNDLEQAIINDDRAQFDDASWRRFCVSDAFKMNACSKELYLEMRQQYLDSNYMPSMSMSDYYNWYQRSVRMLGADGTVGEGALQRANAILDRCKELPIAEQKYMIVREMRVHPMQRAAFDAMVDNGGAPDVAHETSAQGPAIA